jgi:hypothetical protein
MNKAVSVLKKVVEKTDAECVAVDQAGKEATALAADKAKKDAQDKAKKDAQDKAKKHAGFVPFMISGPGGLVSRCSLPIEVVLERGLFHILLGGSDTIVDISQKPVVNVNNTSVVTPDYYGGHYPYNYDYASPYSYYNYDPYAYSYGPTVVSFY